MRVTLYKQLPKPPKAPLVGDLSLDSNEAFLFSGELLLAHLKKPDVVLIANNGIKLRGFEPVGSDRAGREILKYQEWYCAYSGLLPQNGAK